MIDYRKVLEPYVGMRAEVFGFYDTQSVMGMTHNKTVLMQDCEVKTNDGISHYIGHTWVQRASAIISEKPLKGERIWFDAVINTYQRRVEEGENVKYVPAYGLTNPSNVEAEHNVIDNADSYRLPQFKAEAPQSAPTSPTPAPVSPASVLRAVRDLTKQVPTDTLRAILPHRKQIEATIEVAGGETDFAELLELVG